MLVVTQMALYEFSRFKKEEDVTGEGACMEEMRSVEVRKTYKGAAKWWQYLEFVYTFMRLSNRILTNSIDV